MKLFYSLVLAFLGLSNLSAQQSYVQQIIFLNEGWYDFFNDRLVVPPSVGSYDPVSQTYHVFDELQRANFASDVVIDDFIYVAADFMLIAYDKNTLERVKTVYVPGIRNIAIWNDQLLITRGDYLTFFDSYFQVYDKNTLEHLYSLNSATGPQYAAEGIVVHEDKAYVAINNGFVFGEEVGIIGIVDLKTQTYEGEIDMGPAGINPDNIMLGESSIYTLNNKDYSNSSISIIDPQTHDIVIHDKIAANSGCGTSALADDHIYYMEYGVDKLARFDVKTAQIKDTLTGTAAYYGLIDNHIDGQLVATWTDFFSTGIAYILDYHGNVLHSFDVGISPGSIALDVRTLTATDDLYGRERIATIYPNPTSGLLNIDADDAIVELQLRNVLGEILYTTHPQEASTTLAMDKYPSGVYFVHLGLDQGERGMLRVVKE